MSEPITDEIVEALARRRYDVVRLVDKYPENWPTWEDLHGGVIDEYRQMYLNGARADLEAVAPLIAARVLEEMRAEVQGLTVWATRDIGGAFRADAVVDLIQDRLDGLAKEGWG